jgi:hypothetical protein
MNCPLYKRLKENGTSIYVFPGSAEDVSAAYQNENYKMYFSKYMLLNLPAENTNNPGGTQAVHKYFDFATFSTINNGGSIDYNDAMIESLRNYVANNEVSLRESRLNNTEYYYDTSAPETTTEKIFWKWCKKLNIVDFEPAVPQDEFFENLTSFERVDQNDDSYFPEYLWKEREIANYDIINYYTTASPNFVNYLELAYSTITNYREGDIIDFSNMNGPLIGLTISTTVLDVTTSGNTQTIIVDYPNVAISSSTASNYGESELNYHRLVQYIGEVNGVSNVQEANKAYTEVYASVPDHTGQTPDVLFRTKPDSNYRPNMIFPIIPAQYQPEIIGGELFSSPIISNPTEYPGSQYGQFDTIDFTYTVEPGDSLRRSGRFYGVTGDINQPSFDGSTIDGVIVDFDTDHYAKMNITDREVTNFDQFNALEINNQPPTDFEFNAVLWYYTIEDSDGNKFSNLYGISFLNNPDNNPDQTEIGIRFPSYDKFVTNGTQDGSAYSFGLNLNFNIVHDNPVEAYNPEAINSLFSMNLFNEAMRRLSSVNDSFLNIVAENDNLKNEILNLKQLLYTQTDLATINSRINNLDQLLKLYSTQQIVDSDTISIELLDDSPTSLRLNNVDRNYYSINKLLTSEMYDTNGAIPVNITPPENKNFLINVINSDEVNFDLPNNDKLTLLMTTDLSYKQSVDVVITGSEASSENKKLDVFITTINPIQTSTQSNSEESVTPPVETLLVGDVDLPVFYNIQTTQPNSASTWKDFSFPIDFGQNITLLSGDILEMSLNSNSLITENSINKGDQLVLNNMFIGTQSVFDFSGQYAVDDVTGSTIRFDISSNSEFVSYLNSQVLPFSIHTPTSTNLSNNPYISLNKGYKITITRISEDDNIQLSEKYMVDVRNLEY